MERKLKQNENPSSFCNGFETCKITMSIAIYHRIRKAVRLQYGETGYHAYWDKVGGSGVGIR